MDTALITGASRGLGRALATELTGAGWHTIVTGREEAALTATAGELGATAVAGDVADPAHRAALARAVVRAGGLDLLVNNAGTLGTTPLPRLADQPLADLEDALRTNVVAPLALIQLFLPSLRARAGAIVNITSDAAVEGYPTWGGYGLTKAALDQLSRVLAVEEPDVRVWSVDPGEMATTMLASAGENLSLARPPAAPAAELMALVRDRPPSGRRTAAEPVARP
jgi:NAD(P)-dependent dehydrogenase (short-subunit alcohol dehydrogenase family)